MNLLILTHDPVETLDRRIVNEDRVFTERGWQVRIVLMAQADDARVREIEKGISVHPIPVQRLEAVYDPLFHGTGQPAGVAAGGPPAGWHGLSGPAGEPPAATRPAPVGQQQASAATSDVCNRMFLWRPAAPDAAETTKVSPALGLQISVTPA